MVVNSLGKEIKADPSNPDDPNSYGPAGALRDAMYQKYLDAHPLERGKANQDQITGLTLTINAIAEQNVAEQARRSAVEHAQTATTTNGAIASMTRNGAHIPANLLQGNLREVIWQVLGTETVSFADRLQLAEQIQSDLFNQDHTVATTARTGTNTTEKEKK